jgi:hypothetical protein
MITAKDELAHLADCLSEEEAEQVLALLEKHWPEVLGRGEENKEDEQ